MIENVFSPTFGNKPEHFIGREDMIARFENGLKGKPAHPNRASLYIGQRGMGKTALLIELADRSRVLGFVPVRLIVNAAMLEQAIEGIQLKGKEFVKPSKKPLAGFSAGALGFSFGLTFNEVTNSNYGFYTKLTLLIEELAKYKRGVVFLIDEIQSKSEELKTFIGAYQTLVGEGANIAIAMAGLPGISEALMNEKGLTFINRAEKEHLNALPLSEVREYFFKVFQADGVSIEEGALEEAVIGTKGYPYLLQLIGFHIVNMLQSSSAITSSLVGIAIKNAKEKLIANTFSPILRELSPQDKKFLEAMAEDEGQSKISDIKERLEKSNSYVETYKKRLIAAEVIANPSHGVVEMLVPYLAEHLRGEF